jgi:hypothetical protein
MSWRGCRSCSALAAVFRFYRWIDIEITDLAETLMRRSTRITRLTLNFDFEITRMNIFRFSHKDNINLRRDISRIISSNSRIFMLMKNFAFRLSTICAWCVNLTISRNFEMNNSKWTYSKQLCMTILISRTDMKSSVWKIFVDERNFCKYVLSINDMIQFVSTHNLFSDVFLNIRSRNVTKCQNRKIKFFVRSNFVDEIIIRVTCVSSIWNVSIEKISLFDF